MSVILGEEPSSTDVEGNHPPNPKKPRTPYCDVTLSHHEEGIQLFPAVATSAAVLSGRSTTLIVTPMMETLFAEVSEKKTVNLWIEGPPGSGKTTSLYWLYKQLNRLSQNYTPVPCSMESHDLDLEKIAATATDPSTASTHKVLLVDVVNVERARTQLSSLIPIFSSFQTRVLAVSSGIHAFGGSPAWPRSDSVKVFNNYKISSTVVTSTPFTQDQAKQYISRIKGSCTGEELVKFDQDTNLIPRLLWIAVTRPDYRKYLELVITSEFDTILAIMARNITRKSYDDIKILLACKHKIRACSYGLKSVESLIFVQTHIVHCETEESVPFSFLPISENVLCTVNKVLWRELDAQTNISSEAAIANAFENSLPSVLLPAFAVEAMSMNKDIKNPGTKTLQLKFNNLLNYTPVLESTAELIERENTLHKVHDNFPGVDYVAFMETGQLVAIQITLLKEGERAKIENTISKMPTELYTLLGVTSVIVVLINPFWANREPFSTARNWTRKREKYKTWSFAIPMDYGPFRVLLHELYVLYGR